MNWVKRILGEMTGTASIGTVEAPMLATRTPNMRRPTRKIKGQPTIKRKPVSENTADVAPTLVGVAPAIMAKRRHELNRDRDLKRKKKSAVESILGEAETTTSLIPDDAEDLLTAKEIEAKNQDEVKPEDLGSEDPLEPALALVAPDTTPNSARELDPSLVPNRDPAIDTLLGKQPTLGPKPQPKKSPEPETRPQEESLPGGEMPRPPGEFLKPIGGVVESKDSPKIELVMGSNSSVVGSGVTEGDLGAASMPKPQEADISKTMDVFRRFHKI